MHVYSNVCLNVQEHVCKWTITDAANFRVITFSDSNTKFRIISFKMRNNYIHVRIVSFQGSLFIFWYRYQHVSSKCMYVQMLVNSCLH